MRRRGQRSGLAVGAGNRNRAWLCATRSGPRNCSCLPIHGGVPQHAVHALLCSAMLGPCPTCSTVFSTGADPRPISGLRLVSRTSLGVPNQRSKALAADLVPSRAAGWGTRVGEAANAGSGWVVMASRQSARLPRCCCHLHLAPNALSVHLSRHPPPAVSDH